MPLKIFCQKRQESYYVGTYFQGSDGFVKVGAVKTLPQDASRY